MTISIILLLLTFFMGRTEAFNPSLDTKENVMCQKPTEDNPFMNYTLGDLYETNDRLKACKYDDVKDEMREKYRTHVIGDPSDLWGRFVSDRNFYTMPNTDIVNDQTGFAKWCFGNSGMCKSDGINCEKNILPFSVGRITKQ